MRRHSQVLDKWTVFGLDDEVFEPDLDGVIEDPNRSVSGDIIARKLSFQRTTTLPNGDEKTEAVAFENVRVRFHPLSWDKKTEESDIKICVKVGGYAFVSNLGWWKEKAFHEIIDIRPDKYSPTQIVAVSRCGRRLFLDSLRYIDPKAEAKKKERARISGHICIGCEIARKAAEKKAKA